jgi:hypothetical protein
VIFAADVTGGLAAVGIIRLLAMVMMAAANGAVLDPAIIASIRSWTVHSEFPYAFFANQGLVGSVGSTSATSAGLHDGRARRHPVVHIPFGNHRLDQADEGD